MSEIYKIKCYFPIGNLQYATQNYLDSSGNWEGRITTLTLEKKTGKNQTHIATNFTIEFSDMDRYFRNMMSGNNQNIRGTTIELLSVDESVIFRSKVDTWEYPSQKFRIQCSDQVEIDVKFEGELLKEDYNKIPPENEGKFKTIVYGRKTIKAHQVETGKYYIARHKIKTLLKVWDKDWTLKTGATLIFENSESYLNFPGKTDTFYNVEVEGKKILGLLLTNFAEILNDLFSTYTNLEVDQTKLQTFSELCDSHRLKCDFSIEEPLKISEFLQRYCTSYPGNWYLNKLNQIAIQSYQYSDLEPVTHISESQMNAFTYKPEIAEIINKVQYNYSLKENEFQYSPILCSEASIKQWGELYKEIPLYLVEDHNSALDAIIRQLFEKSKLEDSVRFEVSEIMKIELLEINTFEHTDYLKTGSQHAKVTGLNIDFMKEKTKVCNQTVTGTSENLFRLGGPGTTANYNEATAEEKATYGYLCDESGTFADGMSGKKAGY